MTQFLILSIDVYRGLGISPLRTKHPPECFWSRSWPNIDPTIVFFGVFRKAWKISILKFVLIASCTWKFWRVPLEAKLFIGTLPFHWHRSNRDKNIWNAKTPPKPSVKHYRGNATNIVFPVPPLTTWRAHLQSNVHENTRIFWTFLPHRPWFWFFFRVNIFFLWRLSRKRTACCP